jgi:peptidoglycan/xylan/chitin deacetylase (PgdA/CDA1 family)
MFARFFWGLTLCSMLMLATGLPAGAQSDATAGAALPVEGGAYTISLLPGGQALLTATSGAAPATWGGSWSQAEGTRYVRLNATGNGAALKKVVQLEGVIADGGFDVQGLGVDNLVYDREDLDLTLGSGQRHPFVRTINQLATAIPYLNYAYPATDDNVYTENLRRTVARFQEVEGLTPTGLIDLPTLLALVTPAPARLDASKVTFTVAGDVVNVRGGPGTDYPVTQRIYAGDVLDVVGKIGDGTPRGTWLQICCLAQQNGWVRADLGAVTGDLNLIDTVPADQLPPAPTPAPAQPTAGRGQPLLANLPTTTPEGAPVVYLTFDDGPNGAFTQQVLDLLAQYSARATFFVIGRQAAGGADVLRRMASEGSYIGNHTWDHVWLDKISKEEFVDQIQRTRNELIAVAGDLFTLDGDVRYVRPPYGAINADDRQWMAELGYTPVLWDVDPQDWRRPGVETIANHVVNHVFPGAIVLMHDGGGERAQSIAALEIVLRELSARGYRFYNIFGQ